ncbi:hypothetical protein [Daejeonella sp.]|jgi:hypothetical protein|uniref:hypothetical protein n=1 Tax=Daejeonella sp. TaxID=2805397 RepID=UPI0037BF182F
MNVIKKVLFVCAYLISVNLFGQNKSDLVGEWNGKIKDSSGEFEYKLKLEKQNSGIITGTSVSKNSNFYCETRVIVTKQGNKYIVSETEIIKTNYSNRQELCLLKLDLSISDNKLIGSYEPIKNNANCLSGLVSLIKLNISKKARATIETNKVLPKIALSPPQQIVDNVENKLNLQSAEKLKKDSITPNLNQRVVNILKVIELDENEAELIIYDNMTIDGDIITLIDNDVVIYNKVTLTKKPIIYRINNSKTNIHVLKFYAENLGSIPPNTGVLKVKSKSSEIMANFNSDLQNTSSIKIILKKMK